MPTASPETLRSHISGGKLQPVYLLVGDDDRQLDALATALSDTVEEGLRAFNCERVYATDKDLTADTVLESARTAPMMAPHRVVTVLRAEKWLKPKKLSASEMAGEAEGEDDKPSGGAEDKAALAPLVEYLKHPVPSTVLVFVAADVHKGAAVVKALYKNATVVECRGLGEGDPVRGGTALAFIREAASATGRQFEPGAAQLLAERSGGDISKLRADVDHVLLFAQGKRAITKADVEAVSSDREGVQDPWAIVNAIERGQAAEALRLLGVALEEGAVPVIVLGQLAWFVREKLPRVRPQTAAAAVQAAFRTDLDLKSSGGDPRILLERLVLELCGEPRRRR
ncbi:MAG: DNA polymerase III subunit delta [Acidobacteria bacterium]|nr:DNA polymerase III subunit delta [Acidobacteriota bacterium]